MTELEKLHLNINAKNFIIPQGYVQYVATITPKELTVLLEEFSGSNDYKADYKRLQLELSKVKEELQFVYEIKKDIIRQKKSAMIEKEEAEKYLQLQKQYVEEKSNFQLIKLICVKKIIESLKTEEEQVKLELDEQLQRKEAAVSLFKKIEIKINLLSDSFKEFENSISQLEANYQKKNIQNNDLKDNVSYFQEKCNSACTSLQSTHTINNIRSKTIKDLKDELGVVNKRLSDIEITVGNTTVQLDDEQVSHRYMVLRTEVERLTKDSQYKLNDMMHHRETHKYKLDNEIRRKEEIVLEQEKGKLEEKYLGKQFNKLKTLNNLFKLRLNEKKAEDHMLRKKIFETEEKYLYLETNTIEIEKKLTLVKINKDIILQLKKKVAVIQNLKESFPGVHDRLSNLCKPIHPRYNIAVTKVFGKNMDSIVVDTVDIAKKCIYFLKQHKRGMETFLPLDTIKVKPLNEKLRDELERTNFKLLFDVLKVSLTQINKAVLYVTKDIIVCETATEARKKALESEAKYDCVSLDGCYYHKSGIISGGLADLSVKAKQWEDIPDISVLKEQKEQLKYELKNLPNISRMQSDLDIINKDINQLSARNEVIEKDIKETIKEISIQDIKLSDLRKKLSSQDMISEILQNIQENDNEIKIIENNINKIKNDVFVNFCKENNLPDIISYEISYEKHICLYKEQENKKLELLNLKGKIESQLCYECDRDTEFEDKILKCKCAVEQAEAEYNKACEQERDMKIALEQEGIKISHLRTEKTILKKDLETAKEQLVECTLRVDATTKPYLNLQKIYTRIQRRIEQKEAECNSIFKECKIEGLAIPMLSQRREDLSNPSSSGLSAESAIGETLTNIDFSKISEDIRNNTNIDDLKAIIIQFDEKVTKIHNEFQILQKPNLKAHQRVDFIEQQLKEIKEKHKTLRTESKNIETQFELIKAKRHKLLSDCLECINAEIDSIYKKLVNDTSAHALIITENPEEPYRGGIIYNCLPPSKRFTQIQYLSDGEKSLASLALLFAMLRYKPTPFFVMDEADAALDAVNAKKLIRFIETEKNKVQFIIVTLNDEISSHADIALGVTTHPNTECLESTVFALPLH